MHDNGRCAGDSLHPPPAREANDRGVSSGTIYVGDAPQRDRATAARIQAGSDRIQKLDLDREAARLPVWNKNVRFGVQTMESMRLRERAASGLRVRVLAMLTFVGVTALMARVTIPLAFTPVPITLQVLAVLLTGMALGSRDGAISQAIYLATIGAGLPLDAMGLGAAALAGPTAGYLWAFVPAAFLAGCLVRPGGNSRYLSRWAAGLAGVAVIYATGIAWLSLSVGGLERAWQLGGSPFILADVLKAAAAATCVKGAWAVTNRLGEGR